MPDKKTLGRRESFVIRLWQEQEEPAQWRGEIQHVRSGLTTPIRYLGNIMVSIMAHLDDNPEAKKMLK